MINFFAVFKDLFECVRFANSLLFPMLRKAKLLPTGVVFAVLIQF